MHVGARFVICTISWHRVQNTSLSESVFFPSPYSCLTAIPKITPIEPKVENFGQWLFCIPLSVVTMGSPSRTIFWSVAFL